jgi:hypothetical protein
MGPPAGAGHGSRHAAALHVSSFNRPVGERPLALLLDTPGEKDSAATGNVRIFAGGPVQPGIERIQVVEIDRRQRARVPVPTLVSLARPAFLSADRSARSTG